MNVIIMRTPVYKGDAHHEMSVQPQIMHTECNNDELNYIYSCALVRQSVHSFSHYVTNYSYIQPGASVLIGDKWWKRVYGALGEQSPCRLFVCKVWS